MGTIEQIYKDYITRHDLDAQFNGRTYYRNLLIQPYENGVYAHVGTGLKDIVVGTILVDENNNSFKVKEIIKNSGTEWDSMCPMIELECIDTCLPDQYFAIMEG